MNKKVSIIIVHYKANEAFFNCLLSIQKNKPKVSLEVIVVDNDEKAIIDKEIKKKFPWVRYIKSPKNLGFGAGNNYGAKFAKGDYLFFLNPDTIIFSKTIDELVSFLDINKNAAVIAPLLLDPQKNPYPIQGESTLTPLRGIFALSILNKIFPNNPFSKEYWQIGWDKTKLKEMDVVPGTAFMIRKEVYEEVGGFDEQFFLYFEENDLCKRIKEKGYRSYITPKSKLIHLWGKGGTNEANNISKIFKQSRFYYFRKHYGIVTAFLVNAFLNLGKVSLSVIGILLLAAFLLTYRLSELMPFIGDQGWFYISARDMLIHGQIPLVGITSSHTWLHQGPWWTYMLAVALWIGHFNPVSGAYLSALIGLITVWLVYKIGSDMFSIRVGLIASLIYATLPLVVYFARMPYHTESIAPLTLLLFYALYKWINGSKYGFPIIILLFAFLYNFELATTMLFPIFLLIIAYGIIKRTSWVKNILNKKSIILSIFAWLIPMIPMILYDVHHGYPQTVKFVIWIGYKIATVFGFPKIHPDAPGETYQTMFPFATLVIRHMIFLKNAIIAWSILGVVFVTLLVKNLNLFKKKEFLHPYSLLLLFFVIPALAYVAEKTNSDAYWIVFFPTVAFMIALFFDRLMSFRNFFYPALGLLLLFVGFNISALFQTNFLMNPQDYGLSLTQRMAAAKQIIRESNGMQYTVVGGGPKPWSQFISFTMNYQYLTWWLGHGPSEKPQKLQFFIYESPSAIHVQKQIKEL